METKKMLAELSAPARLSMPLGEYIKTEAAAAMYGDAELISGLEPYRLPEITRLICGNRELLERFPGYKAVLPFLENKPAEAMKSSFADSGKDSAFYTESIFPYADERILDSFISEFNSLEKRIGLIRGELAAKDGDKAKFEIEAENLQKRRAEYIEQEKESSAQSNEEELKRIKKELSSLKGKQTRCSQKMEAVDAELKKLQDELEILSERRDRLSPAFREARERRQSCSQTVSRARKSVYELVGDKNTLKQYVNAVVNDGKVSHELSELLHSPDNCRQLLRLLSSEFPDRAVYAVACLYEEGVADINVPPYDEFLCGHADSVSDFFTERYLQNETACFNTKKTDFDSWCDFIVRQAFFEDNDRGWLLFDRVWSRIPSPEAWRPVIETIERLDCDRLPDCLARLILSTSGNPRRYLLELADALAAEDKISGLSAVAAAMIDCHSPGDDCSAIVGRMMRNTEAEHRRLKESHECLKFKSERQSARVYGALSGPIEDLEMLAANISSGKNGASPELVSTRLKKHIAALREGMEALDVFPLENLQSWVEGKPLPFDAERHSISLPTPPKKVYLRTLGFSYRDAAGNPKTVPAIVGRLSELKPRKVSPDRVRKSADSSRRVNSGKHGNQKRKTGKKKIENKEGAEE